MLVLDCPHCGAALDPPVRHCEGVQNKQCDWLKCVSCNSYIGANRRHTHSAAVASECKTLR